MEKPASSPSSPDEPPSTGVVLPEYLRCLQHALHSRGCALTYAQLMGLSGEAFRIFFSGRAPASGASTVGHNPLRAVATILGFDCAVRSTEAADSATDLLADELDECHGPLLVCTDEGWLVVERTIASGLWCCWDPKREAVERDQEWLATHWPSSPGLLELGPVGRYCFSLGERVRESDPRDVALGALQRAHRQMLRQSKVGDCFGGLNAYHQLSYVLARRRTAHGAHDLASYALWHATCLPQLTQARNAATLFLREVAPLFPDEEEQESLFRAFRAYRQVAATMAELPTFDEDAIQALQASAGTTREEIRRAHIISGLWRDRWRITRKVKLLWRLEKNAAESLQRVVQAATRKGRM